ncbi:MAG TPA: class I SAM-dependent methyltransferase [Gammaproteobacteria bacterium]|nr:class I SAM-dependent methyltransferase [Gammaproteobacteria bacterium]
METSPQVMALRGIQESVIESLVKHFPDATDIKVLDLGAGQGALTKKVFERGYTTFACEMNIGNYIYDKVECISTNVTDKLPFPDNELDAIVSSEVVEHLLDHKRFFQECYRVLKPHGKLILSTPNILSLKSRLQFFASGYFWSFAPLDNSNRDGMQHVNARSLEQYYYIAHEFGFHLVDTNTDKFQRTSKGLLIFLPLMYLISLAMRKNFWLQNTKKLMLSRIIVMIFKKS